MGTETRNVNILLSTKSKFTIDNDESKVIEIDTHDFNIVSRLKTSIAEMETLAQTWNDLQAKSAHLNTQTDEDSVDVEGLNDFVQEFDALEQKMRELLDYIFDSDGLADMILGTASAFSLQNGYMKYEVIISALTKLYEADIEKEARKLNRRKVENKTAKYIH